MSAAVAAIVDGPSGTEWHLVRQVAVTLAGQAPPPGTLKRLDDGEWCCIQVDAHGNPVGPSGVVSAFVFAEPVERAISAEDGTRRLDYLREQHPEHRWFVVASVPL